MSDYHILQADEYGNKFRIAFHVSIPDQNNDAGINYRTALVEYLGGASAIQSIVKGIDGTELTQLQAGELIEIPEEFNSNPNEDEPAKRARLDARYTTLVAETQSKYQKKLSYWGYERDVP
jgi:hypothetical protein